VRGTLLLQGEVEHALALAQLGRIAAAAPRLERMVAERRSGDVGELQPALRALSYARAQQGRFAEALALANEAAQILEAITAKPTARAAHKVALADALRDAGLMRLGLERTQDALSDLEHARQRYAAIQGTLAPGHVDAHRLAWVAPTWVWANQRRRCHCWSRPISSGATSIRTTGGRARLPSGWLGAKRRSARSRKHARPTGAPQRCWRARRCQRT